MQRYPFQTLEQLSTILDALPDYIYITDVETTCILYANRAFTALIKDGEFESLVGKTLHEIYPPHIAEFFASQDKQVAETGQTLHFLDTLVFPSRTVHANTYKAPIYTPDGKVYAVLGTSRDMTEMEIMRQTLARRTEELEQTNQLLIASGGFLQSVLDSQTSSIAVIHADGSIRVVNGRWREAAARRPLAPGRGDGIGQNYFGLCAKIVGREGEEAEELERGLKALLEGNIPEFVFEFQHISETHSPWIEVRAARFMSLNAPHVVIAHTDISARKSIELQTAETLRHEKEVSDVKSRFLALVAHEFRTPITIIQSSLDMLVYYGETMTSDRRASQIQKVMGQLKRLMGLIDEISFLYRMQNTSMSVQRTPVAIVPFLRQVISEVEMVHGREGDITLAMGGLSHEASFLLDEMLLHQIFFNLISNAVKYSSPSTPVTILIGADDTTLVVTVADRGIGIMPEDLKRLFEPFYRGGNVEKRNGTGLGLSIVEQSVRTLGGDLSVISQVGVGTTFTVSFPL